MNPIDRHRSSHHSPVQTISPGDTSAFAGRGLPEGLAEPGSSITVEAPIRTMVINDSLPLIFEISSLLMARPRIDLIGMVSDEDAVWDELPTLQPDLIVWTLHLRRKERLQKIDQLRQLLPALRIVIIGPAERCPEYKAECFIPRNRLRNDLWPLIQRQFSRTRPLNS
ncbi:MAG TPA: hypothetical protein VFG14_15790 [Chthoniobacteraceae bacterium]|jgi:hypothetical protein|nr:hypothetical protein [Chthoniobacteraceae bacterium]